jgi:hypothetical protein
VANRELETLRESLREHVNALTVKSLELALLELPLALDSS